eukprot:2093564-Amphidinium_carterae.1
MRAEVVGESDFSWPLQLAEWQRQDGASVQVVATAELLSHDPAEAQDKLKSNSLAAPSSERHGLCDYLSTTASSVAALHPVQISLSSLL